MGTESSPFWAEIVAVYFPYASVCLLLLGFVYRLWKWVRTPTTPIRLRTYPFYGKAKALIRTTGDILFFPRLAQVDFPLWLASWTLHLSLVLMLVGHLRLVAEITPVWKLLGVDSQHIDGMSRMTGTAFGLVFVGTLSTLLLRRLVKPNVRNLSIAEDYFALFLLLAIGLTGMAMRVWGDVEVAAQRRFFLSLLSLKPTDPPTNSLFLLHFFLGQLLFVYLPFGKLFHSVGILNTNGRRQGIIS